MVHGLRYARRDQHMAPHRPAQPGAIQPRRRNPLLFNLGDFQAHPLPIPCLEVLSRMAGGSQRDGAGPNPSHICTNAASLPHGAQLAVDVRDGLKDEGRGQDENALAYNSCFVRAYGTVRDDFPAQACLSSRDRTFHVFRKTALGASIQMGIPIYM